MNWHATRVYELNQTKWGLCKVRMRTADADGGCGRRTADGGPRTADGGRRTADGGRRTADGGRTRKEGQKNKKKILKIF